MNAKPRVLILGGGFAALESAFLLRMRLHDEVDIRLVSDSDSSCSARTASTSRSVPIPGRC